MKTRLLPFPTSLEPLESRIAPASTTLSLASLDGTSGFKLSGASLGDRAGTSVSDAGDVNGDGKDDLLIGAPNFDLAGIASGAAYVVFGSSAGFAADFDLTTLDGSNGFRLTGAFDGDAAGVSVSAAGDVNGDGKDDLIIGAPGVDSNGLSSGSSYVVFGKASFSANVNLATLTAADGFAIVGAAAGDLSGSSVSGAGDVNGDGKDDLIVGAPAHLLGSNPVGAAYVIFGKASFGTTVALASLAAADGYAILGKEGSAGTSVSGAGDVNGDGKDDVIVGVPGANSGRGASYLIYGSATSSTIDLALFPPAKGVQLTGLTLGERSGFSVSDAGDLNADGLADVIVGAIGAKPRGENSGIAYVVFGRADFPAVVSLGSLNGQNGFRIFGGAANDQTGFSVSAAGDFNHDGHADLLIGAPGDTTSFLPGAKPVPGAAFLLYGKSAFRSVVSVFGLNSNDGFRIAGEDGFDNAGASVSAAGDFNGDGVTDLLIGAPKAEHTGADADAGAAYLLYGQDFAKLRFFSNGRIATFGDTDGDLVTVRVTGGTLDATNFTLVPGPTIGFVFQKLDLTAAEFSGVIVSIGAAARPGNPGDGVVNLGFLDATGHDLGNVAIDGDLGQIDAGETALTPTGVRGLSVGSLGTRTDTQPLGTADPLHSEITGSLGPFRAQKNVAGILDVSASLTSITIGENLDGAAGGSEAGLIRADTGIGRTIVRGSVLGGATFSGILSGGKLGSVSISHDLSSADATKPVLLTALGKLAATSQRDTTAIAGLSIGGNVLNAQILAGYDVTLAAMNGDAAIGKVSVKGTWTASDLVAGALDATTNGFGRNDTLIPGHDLALVARIAAVTIRGAALGSTAPGDFFGIVAEQVLRANINRVVYPLTAAPAEDFSIDGTNLDFHLHEVV